MLLLLLLFVGDPENVPPGRDTGFVPLPQQQPPPQNPKAPSGSQTRVQQGDAGPASKPSWDARSPEELGYLYIRRKEPFQALSIFEDLLRANPADVGAKIGKANALYEIARYYQRRARFEDAKKAYGEAVSIDPSLENDEEFNWHRALLGPLPEKAKKTNVYDPRPRMLQHPWIGPHLRFGAQGLVAPGLSIQPIDYLRLEAGFDPIFAGLSAALFAHLPWQWSPYLTIGGKLSFLYPPLGGGKRRAGYEVWQASFVNVGVGVQYRHPMGLYFAAGIDMLITGAILPSMQATGINNFVSVVYPYPFPQVVFGWLFGG